MKEDQKAKEAAAAKLPVTTADVNGSASGKDAGEDTTHDKEDRDPVDFLQKVSSRSMHEAYSADCGSIDELPSEIARVSGARQPSGSLSPRR